MDEEILARRQAFNIKLLAFGFLLTTFSGAIRKWVLTDSLTSNMLLGLQIVFPLAFAILAKTKPISRPIYSLIAIFSVVLIAMAFNPMGQTIWHGLFGFCLHIGVYLPLLIYLNDRETFPLERLNRLLLVAAIGECVLGVIQFISPADSFINKYVRDMAEGTAMLHTVNRVRITGTFSYVGGPASLLFFYAFVIWGMRLVKGNTLKVYWLLGICAIMAPMTGSRGASAYLILFIVFSIISSVGNLRSSVALLAIVGLSYWWYQNNQVSLLNEAYTGFNDRVQAHLEDGETQTRVIGPIQEIVDFRGDHPIFGTGLGGTYQGAIALLGESLYLKDYGYYEEEPERIILEGGFILFFLRLFIWAFIFYRSRIPLLFGLALLYLMIFNSAVIFNVFSAFYTFMGLMYLDRCFYLKGKEAVVPDENYRIA